MSEANQERKVSRTNNPVHLPAAPLMEAARKIENPEPLRALLHTPREDKLVELGIRVVRVGVATKTNISWSEEPHIAAGASAPGHLQSPTVMFHVVDHLLSLVAPDWHKMSVLDQPIRKSAGKEGR